MRELLLKWYPNRKDINSHPIRIETNYKPLQKMRKMKNEAVSELGESKKKLSTQKKSELENDIKSFLRKFKLGMEWAPTLNLLLITGFYSPPGMNFAMSIDDGPTNEKRIRLELNPDTSIDDIKMHWSPIRKFQKEIYPNFRKFNLTEKKFKNMGIATKDLEIRSQKESASFDEVEYKVYRSNDLDWAGILWPDEEDISTKADVKRRNNLRQIRRRWRQSS